MPKERHSHRSSIKFEPRTTTPPQHNVPLHVVPPRLHFIFGIQQVRSKTVAGCTAANSAVKHIHTVAAQTLPRWLRRTQEILNA